MLEREIKLSYRSAAAARAALLAADAEPFLPRRLQDDLLYDTAGKTLFAQGSVLRLRRENARSLLTFKGPVQPGPMKTRDEIETGVASPDAAAAIFARLGFAPWFRYQKYREEFRAPGVIAAIDETPAGVFVEIEGSEEAILAMTSRLGRGSADFILDSYWAIWVRHQQARGAGAGDMLFASPEPNHTEI